MNLRLLSLFIVSLSLALPTPAAPPTDTFLITPWELPPRTAAFSDPHVGIASLRDCNFTAACFVTPADLPICRDLGLRAILRLDPTPNQRWTKLTDDQIEQRVRSLIADTQNDPTVLGYFIVDEPGLPEFPALAKAVAWVKKLAPGKLAYINLFPDYATLGAPDLSQLGTASYEDYLQSYVRIVQPQFISYDNYRVQSSLDLTDAKVAASYFRNLCTVRRVAFEHHLPFWNIVSGNEIRKHTPPPSPANLFLQAYTTLAAGAKGLTWFTYYSARYRYASVDTDLHRTATWSYLQLVNHHAKTLGQITKDLTSTNIYFTGDLPGAQPTTTLPTPLIESVESLDKSPLMIGEFTHPTTHDNYALIVNCSLDHSTQIKLTPRQSTWKSIQIISPADGSPTTPEGDTLWLPAGTGALLKLPQP